MPQSPDSSSKPDPDADPKGTAASTTIRSYDVSELLGGNREVILTHDGAEYRLRVTAKGKLILTK